MQEHESKQVDHLNEDSEENVGNEDVHNNVDQDPEDEEANRSDIHDSDYNLNSEEDDGGVAINEDCAEGN